MSTASGACARLGDMAVTRHNVLDVRIAANHTVHHLQRVLQGGKKNVGPLLLIMGKSEKDHKIDVLKLP